MDLEKDIEKKNSFKVPENYFEYLPSEITDRIHTGTKTEKKIFFLNPSYLIPSLAVVLAAVLFIVFFSHRTTSSNDTLLSEKEVQQVLDNAELYNIDENVITDSYLSSNISDDSLNTATSFSDEEIKSYLEEDANTNNVINEL